MAWHKALKQREDKNGDDVDDINILSILLYLIQL